MAKASILKEFKPAKEGRIPRDLSELTQEERERLKFLGVDESLQRVESLSRLMQSLFFAEERLRGLRSCPSPKL